MVVQVTLADAIEGILDAIVEILTAATQESEAESPADLVELADVAEVVRGDRARPMPELPALWVVPDAAVADHTTLGLAERWEMPVSIAALVSGDEPEEASRICQRLVALARSAVLRDEGRRLGLAYVQDVVSTRFDAHVRRSPAGANRNLHWADATVTVVFKVWEAPQS